MGITGPKFSDDSGYRKIAVTISKVKCSFEYPASYSKYESLWGSNDSGVIFIRPLPSGDKPPADKVFRIDAQSPYPGVPNANSALRQFLEDAIKQGIQFRLLKNSTFKVSGIDGEIIIYTGIFNHPMLYLSPKKAWDIYLDYHGLIWSFLLSTNFEGADEAEKEFEHIIQSFKFLD